MADINKYAKVNMWRETLAQFQKRHQALNNDLKNYGINRRVPFTRFLNVIAKQGNVTLDRYDLKKIATKRRP